MPQALIALLPVILGAAGTGVTLDETLANRPGSPSPATPSAADTAASADKTKQNQLAALSSATPNIQASTGGSLSPDAWAQLAAILSGQAGTPGIGSSQEDLVKKILTGSSGGTVTAGNNTGGGTPGSSSGLTNTTFG